jgi:predicted metal-binding membrane protein
MFGVAQFSKEKRKKNVVEVIMRFQRMLRTQMIITGLGAALLLAGSVKAQEITNTEFSDGPNVTAFAQPTAAVSAQVTPPSTPVMNEYQATSAAVISMPVVSDNGTLASSALERWAAAGLLFMALVVILFYCAAELNALADLKRANRSLRARTAARMSARAV